MFEIAVAVSILILVVGFVYITQRRKDASIHLLLLLFFCTAIGAASENPVVSLLFLAILLYIIFSNKTGSNGLKECKWLILFVIWQIIGLTYSTSLMKGMGMLLKFVKPLLFFTAIYESLKTQSDIDLFLEKIYKIMPFCLILGVIGAIINSYAIAQVFFSMTTIMIPYLLFNTKEKSRKYIYMMLFCLVPPILYAKRTPLLGITLIFISILFVRYRVKAIIPTVIVVVSLVISVFYIPALKEKFFFDTEITIQDLNRGVEIYENINTSGRSAFWGYLLDEIYAKNKMMGAGTGSVKQFIQSSSNTYQGSFMLTHNDFLLMLCENGILGLSIFIVSLMDIIKKSVHYSRHGDRRVRFQSYACLGMTMATICHLFFENCVNTFGFCILYIYYGMFCRQVHICRQYYN